MDTEEIVLVGTDGSPHAQAAVRWASEEAQRRGATLELVHAYQEVWGADRHLPRENLAVGVDASDSGSPAIGLAFEEGASRGCALLAVRTYQTLVPPWSPELLPLLPPARAPRCGRTAGAAGTARSLA